MIYDHFLAKNWKNYHNVPLNEFSQAFYNSLEAHYSELNDKTKYLLPYMTDKDWLYNYQFLDQLELILGQMDKRITFDSNMKESVNELKQDYDVFEDEFTAFFNELIVFSEIKRKELETKFYL